MVVAWRRPAVLAVPVWHVCSRPAMVTEPMIRLGGVEVRVEDDDLGGIGIRAEQDGLGGIKVVLEDDGATFLAHNDVSSIMARATDAPFAMPAEEGTHVQPGRWRPLTFSIAYWSNGYTSVCQACPQGPVLSLLLILLCLAFRSTIACDVPKLTAEGAQCPLEEHLTNVSKLTGSSALEVLLLAVLLVALFVVVADRAVVT